MFHAAARKTYDCAICMYHDQALIPIKTMAFEDAVNVTLGLPFIRTSPDHGTAFDIAGTGKANPSSLIAALRLAARMAATKPWNERDRRSAAAARHHSRTLPVGAQIARPEFPARSQSHGADRARRRPARRCHRDRGRPRPRRADARAAGAGRAARDRGRARRARAGAARLYRETLSGPAARSSTPTRSISIHDPCSTAASAKIVANLPYNIATQLLVDWLSIEPWPPWFDMMVLMFQREVAERIVAHEDEEAYGRLARARQLARRDKNPVRHFARGLRAATEGHLVGGPAGTARNTRAVRPPGAGAGRGRRLRPAPQDAAPEPQIARRRSRPPRRGRRGRCQPARRNHSGLRLCCHGP